MKPVELRPVDHWHLMPCGTCRRDRLCRDCRASIDRAVTRAACNGSARQASLWNVHDIRPRRACTLCGDTLRRGEDGPLCPQCEGWQATA